MHLHIVGICGTFMGGLALIARAAGHVVTGCDANVYPPMSTQLEQQGIALIEGFDAAQAGVGADVFIIGNVVTRGNPLMEAILERGLPYVSGPQWLGEQILRGQCGQSLHNQHVLAVAGTHGKTTTSAMLAWILMQAAHEQPDFAPNFLIGGVAPDLGVSACFAPDRRYFVVEADEYDTAFFDKRSKFVHYRPRTVVLNNLEYDHADIFPDLAAIETQFHHLIRTVPANGCIIRAAHDQALDRVLARGCWSPVVSINGVDEQAADWQARDHANQDANATDVATADAFDVLHHQHYAGTVRWALSGWHNRANALAALAAAHHVGVEPAGAIAALSTFRGVQRRLQLRGTVNSIAVFDDFAHHPTAIAATLDALRSRRNAHGQPYTRILAVIEPRSNTMKRGAMAAQLPAALKQADQVFCFAAQDGPHALGWQPLEVLAPLGRRAASFSQLDALITAVVQQAQPGDAVLVMSNGSFGGIHEKLLARLAA